MPINVGNCISQQVNRKRDCITLGYKYFKEGIICLYNSIRFYFLFDKINEEITKLQIMDNL